MGAPQKGRADYLLLGDWNVACSMCGRKRKASELVKNWQGQYRCPEHNEPRQPQDFARGIKEVISPPWAQIETDKFITFPLTLPVSIAPPKLVLLAGTLPIATEAPFDQSILTENGNRIVTETAFIGVATVILPSWVIPVSYLWSWKSGGAGIFIDDPTLVSTTFQTLSSGLSGVAQVVVTDTLGGVGMATLQVNS